MFDKDKVKINAYLDHELSELEINEVEKLLKEDGEVKEYFESLKKVNLELEAFMKLIQTEKTQQRIKHTLATGKPLIN